MIIGDQLIHISGDPCPCLIFGIVNNCSKCRIQLTDISYLGEGHSRSLAAGARDVYAKHHTLIRHLLE